MAVQDEKQIQAPEQKDKEAPQEDVSRETVWAELPNSAMAAMPVSPPPPGTPNSVMREILDSEHNGAETDRFTERSTKGTPNSILRQMERHPDFGFFHAGFQADPDTSGRGTVQRLTEAHELVHTIRDNAVPVRTGRAAAFGMIQREYDHIIAGTTIDPETGARITTDENGRRIVEGGTVSTTGSSTGGPANTTDDAADSALGDLNPAPDTARPQPAISPRSQSPDIDDDLAPAALSKNSVTYEILHLKRSVSNELASVNSEKRSRRQQLADILNNQRQRLRDVAHSDPNKLERMVFGQVEDGLNKLIKDLQELQKKLNKMRRPSQDELKDILWDKQQKDLELDRLQRLKQQKLDQLQADQTRPQGEQTALERELKAIMDGVNPQTGQADANEALPDEKDVFNLDANGHPIKRYRLSRISKKPINIDGMVKYYRAWCKLNGRDLGEKGKDEDPIRKGLEAAQAALAQANPAAGGGDVDDDEDGSAAPPPDRIPAPPLPPPAPPAPPAPPPPPAAPANRAASHLSPGIASVVQSLDRGVPQSDEDLHHAADPSAAPPVEEVRREPDGNGRHRANSLPARPAAAGRGRASSLPQIPFIPPVAPVRAAPPPAVPVRAAPPPAVRSNYAKPDPGLTNSKWHTANARLAQNIGGTANAWSKFALLEDNYLNYVTADEKKDLDIWDKKKWDLSKSHNGDYSPYTKYVAPGFGLGLGLYGMGTSFTGMVHGMHDTVRNYQNVDAGASHADWIQSGLDTVGQAGYFMSSSWSSVQNAGTLLNNLNWFDKAQGFGNYLNTTSYGNAQAAIPGLSIATGSISAATGTMEAIRGRMIRSELHDAEAKLKRVQPQGAGAQPLDPDKKTDQQKLLDIMEQGHQVAKFHMWSGGLKAVSGGLSAAGGIASLTGAAPVAAAFQGAATLVNIAKFAFDRGYKAHMRKSVVAKELNINWDKEMKDVRDMIHQYNPDFNMRDVYVREVILKAHGSGNAKTRTEAYNQIKMDRARYLMDLASNPGDFQETAELVIKAMGVYKKGGSYAPGAVELLAEKLG